MYLPSGTRGTPITALKQQHLPPKQIHFPWMLSNRVETRAKMYRTVSYQKTDTALYKKKRFSKPKFIQYDTTKRAEVVIFFFDEFDFELAVRNSQNFFLDRKRKEREQVIIVRNKHRLGYQRERASSLTIQQYMRDKIAVMRMTYFDFDFREF